MAFCNYYKNADARDHIVHIQILPLFCRVLPLFDNNPINEIIFQDVKVSLHRRIIIRISGFAHTLSYTQILAELGEFFLCTLTSLIVVQH